MDIFRLISADHEKLLELFKQLHTQREAAENRAQVFAQLKEALERHAQAEEQVFYPALQAIDATQDLAFEAIEDHQLVKELLTEMASSSVNTPDWDEKLEILQENVEEHIEEEESEIFDAARQIFTPQQATELAERWQLARQGQLARSAR